MSRTHVIIYEAWLSRRGSTANGDGVSHFPFEAVCFLMAVCNLLSHKAPGTVLSIRHGEVEGGDLSGWVVEIIAPAPGLGTK